MNREEILENLQTQESARRNSFEILKGISNLLSTANTNIQAQDLLIRALEHREAFKNYSPLLNSLLRESGLFPYIETKELDNKDLLAYETHVPFGKVNESETVFHRVQAQIYWDLLDGKNIVLSAPTSFGKSLITDALIASKKFKKLIIIVPTIALIDETRKRLSKYQDQYKIITHSSQMSEENKGTIYVLTQERVIERKDLLEIDLLIIDEFYKLSPRDSADERSSVLNHAFYKLLKISKQFYLLGPNITGIPPEFEKKYNAQFIATDYVTVATNIIKVDTDGGEPEALLKLVKELKDPTIIYCQSPPSVRRVAELLIDSKVTKEHPTLQELVDWVGDNFDPDWFVTKAISKGIGIHHGHIPRSLAQLQVKLFNENKLRFLLCTSTLIEGVNTIAKNIIIYDNQVAKSKFDYFTFKNIQGRSGRMFRHFIGYVYLFHEPPAEEQLVLDFPVITLSDAISNGLLMQIDEVDMNDRGRQLLKKYGEQEFLSLETIKANANLDPDIQIRLARHLFENADSLRGVLVWNGIPNSDQLFNICKLLYEFNLVPKSSNVIRSYEQLSYLTNLFRSSNDVGIFIRRMVKGNSLGNIDDKIDLALVYLRNWASHHLPKAFLALERIQNDVFGRLGLEKASYSAFAMKLENLMLPPSLHALDEYGIPLQIVKKISPILNSNDNLDATLARMKRLDTSLVTLTNFENNWIESVKPYI